jgi:hypothetical protein
MTRRSGSIKIAKTIEAAMTFSQQVDEQMAAGLSLLDGKNRVTWSDNEIDAHIAARMAAPRGRKPAPPNGYQGGRPR